MRQKDLRFFYVERLKELLNRNSIDSFRVRCNNVFSLIKELREVIDNWLHGYVKQFETVCMCIEETIAAIKEDEIVDFSFYDKKLMIDDLVTLSKADQKARGELGSQSIYLIDKCILNNEDQYLSRIYDAIHSILFSEKELEDGDFKPFADKLSSLSNALACELLNEGFSLNHLYKEVLRLYDNLDDFDNRFDQFRLQHGHNVPLNDYEVVLKMNEGKNKCLTSLGGFKTGLLEEIVPLEARNGRIEKFLANRGALFYQTSIRAHDSSMAIVYAVEKMESVVDKAMLGFSLLDVVVQKDALVVLRTADKDVFLIKRVNVADANYANDKTIVESVINNVDRIYQNNHIATDVKDRLKSSLRHLRIGNTEADTGQQLVNYWVALEFIFSSPKAIEATIPRVEKNLINVLLCCYAQRRVAHLNVMLHKNGTLDNASDWWNLDDDGLNKLIEKQSSQLARYHIQQLKAALLNTNEAAKNFFSEHKKHLYWQLYRIYRYRNKLIHEAAILPGLDNVIRCQRFYLVFLLNQLIGFFSNSTNKSLSMDSFFYEYAYRLNVLQEIIKTESDGRNRVVKLMQIEMYSELIRQNV